MFVYKMNSDFTNYNRSEITSILISLPEKCSKSTVGLDLKNPQSLSEEDYYNLTGITQSQFNELSKYMVHPRNSCNKSLRPCLSLILTKLRTGNSLSILSVMFQISNKSIISKAIAGARIALMEHFVPKFLGFSHKKRDEFIS